MSSPAPPAPAGLYVHLPFCASRCSYCTFAVSTRRDLIPRYLAALEKELDLGPLPEDGPLETLYLGGGTPSLLPPEEIGQFLDRLRATHPLLPEAEVTAEANPEDVTPQLLDAWSRLGINRLSIGIQSFDDGELAILDRRHDAARALEAARLALAGGRFSVNLDLMLAIPGQTPASLERTLAQVLELRPHHLSVYLLEMDKPHRLRALHARAPEHFPGQDDAATAYLHVHELLTGAGWEHYEVSNFARPGHRSRHNMRYWLRQPVHALGTAAHGQDADRRWANLDTVGGYLDAVESGTRPIAWESILSPMEILAEEVMLGLRLADGVPIDTVEAAARVLPGFAERLEAFRELGHVEAAGRHLRLTPQGWLVSNELFATLV